MPEPLLIAKARKPTLALLPALANRHGLIAGATGTGKTVTLQTLAEALLARSACRCSWPTSKATSSGLAAGRRSMSPKLKERLDAARSSTSSQFARLPGRCSGTCSAKPAIRCAPRSPTWGRCCSARMLNLNDTQQGVLTLVFKIADDNGLLLLDLKDLRAMLQHVGDNAKRLHHRVRQHLGGHRSAPSSAGCSNSSSRAATVSSASRRSTSTT